jgi:Kef-type K+ transport system membrane component KefB
MPSIFHEIAFILALAAIAGGIATALRQPLIVAFIAVGLVAGPLGFDIVQDRDAVDLLAKLGIAVLLFVVGLKLDVDLVRSVGRVALATGIGQVLFTSGFGFVIARLLGLEPMAALYVAVALTFSSTIIIVKLLSDKREIDSLHGRIAVGFLIVQDIVVIVVMVLLSAFAGDSGEATQDALRIAGSGIAFVAAVAVLARFVLPWLLDRLARSPEMLMLFAITWAVALAAAGDTLGFSKEVGAFIAGVSLASTRYREALATRLVSIRDFMLLFFFLDLGAKLDVTSIGDQLPRALALSVFVLVGNPLIVLTIMGLMGYRRRTSLLAGLTVAQISEFSLIFGALGVTLGHITQQTLSLITVVGIITIGLSTYLILYSHKLYELLAGPLRIFERKHAHSERAESTTGPSRVDAIVLGLGRYGDDLAVGLSEGGMRVLGVDFDPGRVRRGLERGIDAQYGDAEDPEIASILPLARASWVVSTLPDAAVNLELMQSLEANGYAGSFAATAHDVQTADRLRVAGADLVLLPFADAAERAVERITEAATA